LDVIRGRFLAHIERRSGGIIDSGRRLRKLSLGLKLFSIVERRNPAAEQNLMHQAYAVESY